ncbi:MAG: class I mannose-6-phosphate isomerase [Oscillospiraceae bacterium]|jgi:mannose-6-phosphate isomerase|nr:class I mannose-6-phosphate isomerase [Oscillospiraceae bacterium]
MPPLKLIPAFKDYIWGGTRLKTEYNKTADSAVIAESWELSCHPDGESVVADGEHAGLRLSEYLKSVGHPPVPVIVKLIDAADNLSVQVHPNDEQAAKDGDRGKTEMWHVVDAEPDSELIYGFNRPLTRGEFRARIENGSLLEVVNRIKVRKGDAFFIPAGTLHAIGKGILIAEIQQSSNLTYRVYDYDRTGADGSPRELHIEKAVEVTDLNPPRKPYGKTRCEHFRADRISVGGGLLRRAETSFNAVLVLSGEADVDGVKLKKGETCFVPAGYGDYAVAGKSEIIVASVV